MVIKSNVVNFVGVKPPIKTPLVELEHPPASLKELLKSPKSTALPVVAISTKSIIFDTEGVNAPPKQTLVGDVTPAT